MTPRIRFVTGKGGVGKTTISLLIHKQNPHSALSETASALSEEASKWGLQPGTVHRYLTKDLAQAFLQRTIKVGFVSEWIAENKLFQNLMELAPNLHELLLLEQWLQLSKRQPLIVDAPSTGHFLALFQAIQSARKLFDSGSLRKLSEELFTYLNSTAVEVVIVSLPEHSSLEESREIAAYLKQHFPAILLKNILNRKHRTSNLEGRLEEPWQALAFERPLREEDRIRGWHFEQIVYEGEPA